MLHFVKRSYFYLAASLLLCITACHPTDRSGEQPFPPTVVITGVESLVDSCRLFGEVTASPNSDLTRCGFRYGNDTLRLEVLSAEATPLFSVTTTALSPGRYYAVAFARNGVGESFSDTIWFEL